MLPATTSPPFGKALATSKRRMSDFTTSTFVWPARTSRSTGMRRRSSSTATRRLQRGARAMVNVPAPAPTSSTSSSLFVPAASAIASRVCGSTRKFWPKRCWRVMPWRCSSLSSCCKSAGSITSLHLLKQRDRVLPLLVGELFQADPTQRRHGLRRVEEIRRAIWDRHALLRVAVRRIRLEQQPVGRAMLDDFPQLVPARAGDQAREGQVEPDLEEPLSPSPIKREVMHDAPDPRVLRDDRQQLSRCAAVVDGDREVDLGREAEQVVQVLHLQVAMRPADMLEVEADLSDDDDHLVLRKLPHGSYVWICELEWVVPHSRPHLFVCVGERNRVGAAVEVHADGDQPRHARGDGLLHHLGGLAELLEVEVGVYEDGGGSSSLTSSSRLKSACGAGSVRPGSSCEGRQRSTASYSPVMTVSEAPFSENSRTSGWGAITSS